MSGMSLEELMRIKRDLEKRKEERSRLKGRLDQLKSDLKANFDCSSVKDARELLGEMQSEVERKMEEYERLCDEFKKEYMDDEL